MLAEQLIGHTTVQASAGSGKTYLLISRIVRLLLTGVEPGNILAITFTRKAANEMQTRLLERLYTLAIADIAKLKILLLDLQIESSPANIERARCLYEKVLRNEHPVKTTTFHAFCQDLLRQFPMEADVPVGFDLIEQTALLYNEAWESLMLEATDNKDKPLGKSLHCLFKELGLFNSKTALKSFLNHRSDWWAYTTDETDPVNHSRNKLQQQININPESDPVAELFSDKNNDLKLLGEFQILLNQHDTATNIKTSHLIDKVFDVNNTQDLRFQCFISSFLTQTGEPLKTRKISKTLEKKLGIDGQTRFLEIHMLLSEKLIEVNLNLAAIRTLRITSAWYLAGHHYLAQFQKLKKEQRLLDFTDLEWDAYILLNQSNNALWIQYKLDQRIDHLLVDEFQDTNPTQWRLLLPFLQELAASEDERQRSVFLVGDEKQSIYRFRRAEPRLFSAAEKWLRENLNATTCELSYSWRSSPAIIGFINKLFMHESFNKLLPAYIRHDTHLDDLAGKVTLLPLSLKEIVEKNEENTSPLILRNPLKEPRTETINLAYFNEGLLIAKEIKLLIQDKTIIKNNVAAPVNYNDIIILLRSRTHVNEYERALRQKGIPYIGAARGTLLDSLEVNDLLDLLQWLILPFDDLAFAGILRSPIFNLSNEDLISIKESGKGNWLEKLTHFIQQTSNHKYPGYKLFLRAHRLLTKWQKDADKLPVHDLLDKIYSEGNVLERYSAAFPSHLIHRVRANLNRFLELALEIDSGRYPSLMRFSTWINELRQLENDAPDEPVSQTAILRVRILSIHAAKGLEAPIIFLADSASTATNKKAYTTLIDWPAEKESPDYFILTSAKKNLDEFSLSCIKYQETFESRENANLLYVALTRAKQFLYISGTEPKDKDHGWYGKISQVFNPDNNDPDKTLILDQYNSKQAIHPVDKPNIKDVLSNKNDKLDEAYSQPIKIIAQQLEISPSQQDKHFYSDSTADADNSNRGILLHKMLDYISQQQKGSLSDFINFSYSEAGVFNANKTDLEKYWDECQRLIQNKEFSDFFDPDNFDKYYNEVPIQFHDNKKLVHGIIDRLIIKDKHAIIIDYKTHPYATKENIKEIALNYKNQMGFYQKGVKLLWPNHSVTAVLLFTSIQTQYIIKDK